MVPSQGADAHLRYEALALLFQHASHQLRSRMPDWRTAVNQQPVDLPHLRPAPQ